MCVCIHVFILLMHMLSAHKSAHPMCCLNLAFVLDRVTWRYFCNRGGNLPHVFLCSCGVCCFVSVVCWPLQTLIFFLTSSVPVNHLSIIVLHVCKCICTVHSHERDDWVSVYTCGILAPGKLTSIGSVPTYSSTRNSMGVPLLPEPCSMLT